MTKSASVTFSQASAKLFSNIRADHHYPVHMQSDPRTYVFLDDRGGTRIVSTFGRHVQLHNFSQPVSTVHPYEECFYGNDHPMNLETVHNPFINERFGPTMSTLELATQDIIEELPDDIRVIISNRDITVYHDEIAYTKIPVTELQSVIDAISILNKYKGNLPL